MILPKFSKKPHEIDKILGRSWEPALGAPPLDLPLNWLVDTWYLHHARLQGCRKPHGRWTAPPKKENLLAFLCILDIFLISYHFMFKMHG